MREELAQAGSQSAVHGARALASVAVWLKNLVAQGEWTKASGYVAGESAVALVL